MAIKAATVINKEKDSVTTTISIDDIINEIVDTVHAARSYTLDTFKNKINSSDFSWCKLLEFPELCYQRIKDKIPKLEPSSQQKILKDIAKAIVMNVTLIYVNRSYSVQSFFLVSSKNKADFLRQVKALKKEFKYLLNVYSGPFLSLCNKHDKGEVNLEQKDLSACNYFLSSSKEVLEYDQLKMPDINCFSYAMAMPLLKLAKKDFKTYKSYLTNEHGYIYELIKNDIVLNTVLNDLYRLNEDVKKFEFNQYHVAVKVLLVQVFLATYKKNTNLKDSEVREFLLEFIFGLGYQYYNNLVDLMTLYGV